MEETIQGFLRSIIGYDDFLSGLSSKAQLLYFYLVIHADTDGFVYNGQVLSTMVMRSRTQKYLNELVKGNFVTTEEHVGYTVYKIVGWDVYFTDGYNCS